VHGIASIRKGHHGMDPVVKRAIYRAVTEEPLARTLGIELRELGFGRSLVEMVYEPAAMDNIYGRAHGGAIFALIDEAFETAAQTDGTVAVALNVNVSYVASPEPRTRLRAEAHQISRTKKTAAYAITVSAGDGSLIATCQALAYRTGKPIPFLDPVEGRSVGDKAAARSEAGAT
jgi:acyl-CoA thioesterase